MEVQILDGSVFSGIFHATNADKDFGMSGKLKLDFFCFILSSIDDPDHCSVMYSAILHLTFASIIELCSGIILKMAHLIKDGSQGRKNTPESLIKPPTKTLIIPGKELVQVIAKVCV